MVNSGFCIYDLKSTHGTFLNNERLPQMQNIKLRHGDRLKFGALNCDFIFEDIDAVRSESVETAMGDTTLNTVHSTTGLCEPNNDMSVNQKLNMVNSLLEQLKDEKKKPVLDLMKALLQKWCDQLALDSMDVSQPDTTEPEDELEAELGRLHAQEMSNIPTLPLDNLSQSNNIRSGYTPNLAQRSTSVQKSPEPNRLEPNNRRGPNSQKKIQPALQNAINPPVETSSAKRVSSGGPLTEHNSEESMITKRIGPISSKIIARRSLQLMQQQQEQQQRQAQVGNEQDPLAGLAGFDIDPFAAIPDKYVVPRGSTDNGDVPAPIVPPKVEQDGADTLFRKPKQPVSQMNGQQSDTSSSELAPVVKRKGRPPKYPRPESSLSESRNLSKELSIVNSVDRTQSDQSKRKGRPPKQRVNSPLSLAQTNSLPVPIQNANTTDLGKRVRKRNFALDDNHEYEDSTLSSTQSQMNETFPAAKKRGRKSKAELAAMAAQAASLNTTAPMPLSIPTAAARKQHDTPLNTTPDQPPKKKGRPPKSAAAKKPDANNKSPIKIVISLNKQQNPADGSPSVSSFVSNVVSDDAETFTPNTKESRKRGPYKKTIEKMKQSGKTEEELEAEIAAYVPPKKRRTAETKRKEVVTPTPKAKVTKRVSFPKYVEFNEEQQNQLVHSVPIIRLQKLSEDQISKMSKASLVA